MGSRLTCEQDAADHPWHHHEEHGQQLQVPTHDAGGLHVGHVPAWQAALHDDLPGKRDVVWENRRVTSVKGSASLQN